MQPRYVLPAVAGGSNINLDIKPKQVAAWLNRLPLSNPLEAAEEIADYLATANRTKLAHDVRAKMLEAVGPVVEETVSTLREQYHGTSLPLPPRYRPNPELAQRLLLELATSYKILVLEWLGRTFHLNKRPLPHYLQQILLSLQQVLEISFETHENVPNGVWVDLHQTFNFALRDGLAEAIPENAKKMQTLEQIYKSTLLMALADPYRFPQIEMPWARDIIDRFSNLANLFPAEEAKGQAGIFIIEVNTDAPPKPLAWEQHPTNPRWDLMLNTTELAKHLAMLSAHVKGKEDPEKLGLPAAARDPEYAVMLRRLKLSWGASIQRQSQRRHHQRGREFEVCFGLRSICQLIGAAGAERQVQASNPSGASEPPPVVMRCQTVDDSMGGLALRKSGTVAAQVKVGDLAGIRQGNGSWSVGLVRWFRVPASGEMFFGIQLIAPKAISVQVRRNDNGRQFPGLLIQASPALKQSAMLLSPPGCLEPEQPIEVRAQGGSMAVRIEKRLEYTPSVEVFRIAVA